MPPLQDWTILVNTYIQCIHHPSLDSHGNNRDRRSRSGMKLEAVQSTLYTGKHDICKISVHACE